MCVCAQVENARLKAASRMDDIITDEVQNSAVFKDLANDAAGAESKKRQQIARLHADWSAQRVAQEEDRQLQQWSDGILTDTQTLMPEKTGVKPEAEADADADADADA